MRRIASVGFALTVTVAFTASSSPASPGMKQEVERAVNAFVADGTIEGAVVILITPHGEETIRLGRIAEHRAEPPDARTRFGIASVTKLFTGLLLADLLREGRVRLDDPASQHLPRQLPRFEGRELTLRQLATHTAALPVGRPGETLFAAPFWRSPRLWRIAFRRTVLRQNAGPLAGVTTEDLLVALAGYTFPRPPGTLREYSNIGMGLLGEALGRADGRGYEEAVAARILRPLGLNGTGLGLIPGSPTPVHYMNLGPLAGAGGMVSTAADLAVLARAFLGKGPEPLLHSIELLLTPAGNDPQGHPYFLAFARDPATGRPYHTGQSHAFLGLDRKRRAAAVVLLAGSLEENEALGLAILDRLAGGHARFPAPRRALSLSRAVLNRYAGVYTLNRGSSAIVTAGDQTLLVQFMKGDKKGGTATLRPETESRFYCREWECLWEFELDAGNLPVSARVKMYSFEGTYRKAP